LEVWPPIEGEGLDGDARGLSSWVLEEREAGGPEKGSRGFLRVAGSLKKDGERSLDSWAPGRRVR
jgi:hypothetical protein